MLDLKALENILNEEGSRLILDLQALMVSTGANATGRTSRSLELVTRNNNSAVGFNVSGDIGWAYVEQGRGKTLKTGNGEVLKAIKEWIDAKGITPKDGISKDALAYLITRKIHREGTKLFILNQRRDIYTSLITDEYIDKICDKLGTEIQAQVAKDITI